MTHAERHTWARYRRGLDCLWSGLIEHQVGEQGSDDSPSLARTIIRKAEAGCPDLTVPWMGVSNTRMRVVPAAEAGWEAVESVFRTDASTRNCWCQFHVLDNREQRSTTRDSRRRLLSEQIITLDPPRGLVALAGDEAVGWCGVEPRTRLRHVLASRLVTRNSLYAADNPDIWAVYCILVPSSFRLQGIAAALLDRAIDHARNHGAWAIEGYPIDTSQRDGLLPPGFSTGTLAMFEREGFQALATLPSGRTLVHRDLREV